MNIRFILVIASLVLVLSACVVNQEKPKDHSSQQSSAGVDVIEEKGQESTNDTAATEEVDADEDFSEADILSAEVASELSTFNELEHVKDYFTPDDFETKVLADNEGKRVLLFSDKNSHQQYKTIYVKYDGFLKIIDLQNNKQYVIKDIK